MTRRTFAAATVAAAATSLAAAPAKSKMGIATTCYMSYRRFRDTKEFLEHGIALGAAGIQSALTSLEPDYLKAVERRAKDNGMFVEVMLGLPKTPDTAQFEATVAAAKKIGALCVRSACLSGRRYETFASLDEWRKFVADSEAAIARAVPIAEKHKLPFAIENHKDWTVDEFVTLLKRYSSGSLGVCLDLGNNVSLLDDPMEVVERLAPYTISTHIKDMGVAPYQDGFLLSEVVLGKGMLDLKRMIATVQRARPETKLTLEMITRDPLKVPVLTDKYWATFPNRSGIYMARTVRSVHANTSKLPVFSHLSKEEQIAAEEQNVRECLAYPV